ncbi:hypothetical protein MJH12_15260 [bacterium]|nr:hypothetical protein [bacterium]
MKIEALKNVFLKGEKLTKGKTYEYEDELKIKDAKYLCLIGAAKDLSPKKKEAKK